MKKASGKPAPKGAVKADRSKEAAPPVLPYQLQVSVEDFGAVVHRAVLRLPQEVKRSQVKTNSLSVFARRYCQGSGLEAPGGEREVTAVSVCDEEGQPAAAGRYLAVDLAIGPDLPQARAHIYAEGRNTWARLAYEFTLAPGLLKALFGGQRPRCRLTGILYEGVEAFTFGLRTYGLYTYSYAAYAPKARGRRPLLVWLHGYGEGGSDPSIPLSANKATVFATEAFQRHFGGIHVLVPQAPTYWMDGGEGRMGDGSSLYEEGLMRLIRAYVAEHDIDEQKILVGGLSNGGYMTMLLARDYPDYFRGYVPVCEALADRLITDEQIATYARLPLWFVSALTDDTVKPEDYVLPTVRRIGKAGGQAHLTMYDKVLDQSGLYKANDGQPHEYNGHLSWIPVYNNEPLADLGGGPVSLFEWLASLVTQR